MALSSAEAELYGVVKAAAQGMGILSLARDLGEHFALRIYTDSSAAEGVCKRKGLGKLRHLDTNLLWVQDKLKSGGFTLHRVPGGEHPADLVAKHLSQRELWQRVATLGTFKAGGRSTIAPDLSTLTAVYAGLQSIRRSMTKM